MSDSSVTVGRSPKPSLPQSTHVKASNQSSHGVAFGKAKTQKGEEWMLVFMALDIVGE